MGFIFSKFSKLGSGVKPPSPNPSVAEAKQLFEPTYFFWAGYATAWKIGDVFKINGDDDKKYSFHFNYNL